MALIAATLTLCARPAAADQYTDKIGADQQQQQQINAEIASLKAEVAAAQNQESKLQGIIASLNTKIAAAEAQVAAAKAELAAIDADLAAARTNLSRARVQLQAKKEQLARALIVIYEMQQQSTALNNLLASDDFNAFWTSVIDGRRISDQEAHVVADIHRDEGAIQDQVVSIAAKQQRQQVVVAQVYDAQQQLDAQRSAQLVALDYLRRLQARDLLRQQQMQAAYNTLNAEIATLQQQEAAALAAGGGNGQFGWPENGPISQGFGCTPFSFEPYDPGCPQRHFHNGLDIAGPCGANLVAADSGIVHIEPYQSWGFGNYIIMVHGNGWETLYGHMSGFAVGDGQRVHRGQLIGWEGTSGNSTGCHVHFGVNHNNSWVNPLAYLS